MSQINTALVGFGDSARYLHAPFLIGQGGFALTDVFERSKDRAAALYPGIRTHRTLETLLAAPDLELVVISTPNDTHVPYVRQALEAGKHVVVEKPFTPTAAEAEALIALARSKNRVLTVYQNRRWDSDFQTVRRVLDAGELGELRHYEAHFDRYKPILNPKRWKETPAPGSGILYDLGAHLLDQALVLFGTPQTVYAEISTQRDDSSIDDCFHLRLGYPRLTAVLRASLLVREPGPRYVLHGARGTFRKPGIDIQEDQLKAGMAPTQPGFGREPDALRGELVTEIGGQPLRGLVESVPGNWLPFYEHVYDAIRHGGPVPVDPAEVLTQLRIIELVFESARQGRKLAVPQ
jgi:scyllo-inositol 2-dehydrogenase (NADP+)